LACATGEEKIYTFICSERNTKPLGELSYPLDMRTLPDFDLVK
jgi:hypothetical protein